MPLSPELQPRATQAAESLAEAERELSAALLALRQGERGDKVMISTALETAFEKVSAARAALAALLAEPS